ncbi:MAG TPA: hypothetical protein VJU78_18640 [Chitinophagaceae bacterium]|nr:hypothetical protein [Chitinophagaceae bacterium]
MVKTRTDAYSHLRTHAKAKRPVSFGHIHIFDGEQGLFTILFGQTICLRRRLMCAACCHSEKEDQRNEIMKTAMLHGFV